METSNKTFKYEITEKIAVLSQDGNLSKEINKVSYRGYTPKYDIRTWDRSNGKEVLGKGITLNDDEMAILKEALLKI